MIIDKLTFKSEWYLTFTSNSHQPASRKHPIVPGNLDERTGPPAEARSCAAAPARAGSDGDRFHDPIAIGVL